MGGELLIKPAKKFKSDEEFAAWAESAEGRAYMNRQFDRAKRAGNLRRGLSARAEAILGEQRAVPVSIRLAPEDIQKARAIAARKGAGYQTYIKMLVHEALASHS